MTLPIFSAGSLSAGAAFLSAFSAAWAAEKRREEQAASGRGAASFFRVGKKKVRSEVSERAVGASAGQGTIPNA